MDSMVPTAFAFLLEEDSEDDYKEETNIGSIPCLKVDDSRNCIELTIEDWLFGDQYSEKMQMLLKYLKHDKEFSKHNKYKRFDLNMDLTQKELEIQTNDALFVLKYILELSKKFMTTLSIDITAYASRTTPFNDVPHALDSNLLRHIFEIIRESVCRYRLQCVTIHWIPVNVSNYMQIQDGIQDILNSKPTQKDKQISMNILIACSWMSRLHAFDPNESFINAIKQCAICNDLTLTFDKDTTWSTFDTESLKNMVRIFNALACNRCVTSLSLFVDNFVTNNTEYVTHVVSALGDCLRDAKAIQSLSLSFDANINQRDLHSILDALYDNDNIGLNSLSLYRSGTNFDSKSIRLICDLLESEQHRMVHLTLDGEFVSSYCFGVYKMVGFDALVDCLLSAEDIELQTVSIAIISDDGDSDIYTEYVIQLIRECNIWLGSITVKYERFDSMTRIIDAFFHRLQRVYESLECAQTELSGILDRQEDIVNLIVDFCKMDECNIFIIDNEENNNSMDLTTERAEFREYLYSFFNKISFEVTPKLAKNRNEFQKLSQTVSSSAIGIYKHRSKEPSSCVSLIL
eukprot:413514_1